MRSVDFPFARHDLVWLESPRWREALLAPLSEEWTDVLAAWFECDRPAVVRRRESSAANAIDLGVALAPARGKVKISFVIDRSAVMRSEGPLALVSVAASAGAAWRPWLEDLAERARELGVEFRVYGSLAWQHLSGESYLTPASDIDLLWHVNAGETLRAVLQLLTQWQRASGLRADGELLLPDGAAIAWRELLTRPDNVLTKRIAGVELRRTDEVLSQLEGAPC